LSITEPSAVLYVREIDKFPAIRRHGPVGPLTVQSGFLGSGISDAAAGVVAGPTVEVFGTGVVDITDVVIDGTTVDVEGDS